MHAAMESVAPLLCQMSEATSIAAEWCGSHTVNQVTVMLLWARMHKKFPSRLLLTLVLLSIISLAVPRRILPQHLRR